MNTKQKITVSLGLAVVIAMASHPPWATWCNSIEPTTYQYGWIFGRLNPPDCAEKLTWTWGLAADRLLLQWALVIGVTAALTFAFRRPTADKEGG